MVDPQLARDLALRLGIDFMETSAKDSTNVRDGFHLIIPGYIDV